MSFTFYDYNSPSVEYEESASSLTLPNTTGFSEQSGFLLWSTDEGWPLLDI